MKSFNTLLQLMFSDISVKQQLNSARHAASLKPWAAINVFRISLVYNVELDHKIT